MNNYRWDIIQAYYDAGHSFKQCQRKFGFVGQTWNLAIQRGAIRVRSDKERFLLSLSVGRVNSHNTKEKLIKHGLKQRRCECCQLDTWQHKPIPLELHHIDGNRKNNDLTNLQVLCPNCHAQTKNYGTRNVGRVM